MAATNRYPMQRPEGSPSGSPRRAYPKPANTNRPPVRPPMPANDNFPRPLRPPPGMSRRLFGKMLARAVPGLGLLLLASDLYDLWRWIRDEMETRPGQPFGIANYTRRDDLGDCSLGSGSYVNYHFISGFTNLCGGGALATANPGSALAEPYVQAQIYEWWRIFNPTHPARIYSRRWRWDKNPNSDPGYIIPEKPVFFPDPFELPYLPGISPEAMPRPNQPTLPWVPPVRFQPKPNGLPESSTRGHLSPRPTIDSRSVPRPRPAPRGTKERKVKGLTQSAARRFMGRLLSNWSEVGDFLDILHDNLPDHLKTKDATQAEKVQDLYNNWEEVDTAKALQDFVQNEKEDQLLAKGFEQLTKALEGIGIELGSLRIPSGHSF